MEHFEVRLDGLRLLPLAAATVAERPALPQAATSKDPLRAPSPVRAPATAASPPPERESRRLPQLSPHARSEARWEQGTPEEVHSDQGRAARLAARAKEASREDSPAAQQEEPPEAKEEPRSVPEPNPPGRSLGCFLGWAAGADPAGRRSHAEDPANRRSDSWVTPRLLSASRQTLPVVTGSKADPRPSPGQCISHWRAARDYQGRVTDDSSPQVSAPHGPLRRQSGWRSPPRSAWSPA